MKTTDTKSKTTIHSIGVIVLFFAQWLISMLLVRMGGFYDAGVFSLAMTVSNVFAYFANFGVRTFMLTETRGIYTTQQYKTAGITAIAGSYMICVGYLLIASHYSSTELLAIILYLTYNNFNSFSEILFGKMQLSGRLEVNGFSNLIRGCSCFIAFIISYLLFRQIVLSLICMAIVSAMVMLLFDARQYRRIVNENPFSFSPDMKDSIRILVCCVPIMLTNVLPLVTTAIPRTEIQKQLGTEMLGFFSTIFTPTVIISVLVPTIMQSILPRISREWEEGTGSILKEIGVCYLAVLAIAGIAEIAALVCGKYFMRLLFGDAILTYYSLLYWAILVTAINAMVAVGNHFLIAMHSNKSLLISNVLALVICLALSGMLIRSRQLNGATYALITAYCVQVVFQICMIMREIHRRKANE